MKLNHIKRYFKGKLMLIGFLLFIGLTKPVLFSQTGFAKAIPFDAIVDIDDILYQEDQLIVRGNVGIDSLSLYGLLLAGLDTMGNVLWTRVIYDTSFSSHLINNTPARFMVTSDHRLMIPVKYYNTGDLAIYFTDLSGQELFHRFYPYEGFNIFPFDLVELDGYYYVAGTNTYEGGNYAPFVLKIRPDGEMVWIKYYGDPNEYEEAIDVDINSDHTITLSATQYNRDFLLSEGKEGWKKPWLFTIDTSGAIISEWIGEKNDPRTLGGEYFLRLDNGDWIIQSTHFKNVPTPFGETVKTSPTVTRLDSNFNQIWKMYLSDYEERSDRIGDMDIDTIDQSIVIAGSKYVPVSDKFEYVNCVVRLDTAGSLLWDRTDSIYFDRKNTHYTAGLVLSPSGSIYVGGYVTVEELVPRSQGFII